MNSKQNVMTLERFRNFHSVTHYSKKGQTKSRIEFPEKTVANTTTYNDKYSPFWNRLQAITPRKCHKIYKGNTSHRLLNIHTKVKSKYFKNIDVILAAWLFDLQREQNETNQWKVKIRHMRT